MKTSYNLTILQSYNLTFLQSYNLTILQAYKLTISQSYNFTNWLLTTTTLYLFTYLLTRSHNVDTKDSIGSKNTSKFTLSVIIWDLT